MSLSIILVLDIIIEYLLQLKYSMILTILHFSICCTNILHVYTSRYEQVFTLNHFIMSPHNIDRGDCSIDTLHICIIRSIIIYVIHSIIIRLLYLTTPYENIIVYTIPDNTMFCKKFIMNSIFIIAIGSQIIVLLTSKINILLRSLSLRNNHCKYSYIYILQHLCNILYYSISQLSSNLLYREICVDSCNFCDLNNTAY